MELFRKHPERTQESQHGSSRIDQLHVVSLSKNGRFKCFTLNKQLRDTQGYRPTMVFLTYHGTAFKVARERLCKLLHTNPRFHSFGDVYV